MKAFKDRYEIRVESAKQKRLKFPQLYLLKYWENLLKIIQKLIRFEILSELFFKKLKIPILIFFLNILFSKIKNENTCGVVYYLGHFWTFSLY